MPEPVKTKLLICAPRISDIAVSIDIGRDTGTTTTALIAEYNTQLGTTYLENDLRASVHEVYSVGEHQFLYPNNKAIKGDPETSPKINDTTIDIEAANKLAQLTGMPVIVGVKNPDPNEPGQPDKPNLMILVDGTSTLESLTAQTKPVIQAKFFEETLPACAKKMKSAVYTQSAGPEIAAKIVEKIQKEELEHRDIETLAAEVVGNKEFIQALAGAINVAISMHRDSSAIERLFSNKTFAAAFAKHIGNITNDDQAALPLLEAAITSAVRSSDRNLHANVQHLVSVPALFSQFSEPAVAAMKKSQFLQFRQD